MPIKQEKGIPYGSASQDSLIIRNYKFAIGCLCVSAWHSSADLVGEDSVHTLWKLKIKPK